MLYTFKQKSTKKIILNFTYSTPRKENGDPYWNLPYNSHFYFLVCILILVYNTEI